MKYYEDKEYWEMCRKAKEIQGVRNGIWIKGDRILNFKLGKVWLYTFYKSVSSKLIWLPSQEDLQEIYCKEKKCKWVDFLLDFHRWLYGISDLQNSITKTHIMQALAKKWNSETTLKLAFVMDVVFKEKWNPDKKLWEKE